MVAGILPELIRQEDACQQSEYTRPAIWLGWRQAVNVRAACTVSPGRDIERGLNVFRSFQACARHHQRLCQIDGCTFV